MTYAWLSLHSTPSPSPLHLPSPLPNFLPELDKNLTSHAALFFQSSLAIYSNGHAPCSLPWAPPGVAVGDGHVHQPALPPPVRAGAAVREAPHAQRRRQAQPAGDPQAARGEVLPSRWRRRRRREGPATVLRGRSRQAVAVPVLVLDQQPELRTHQGLEPVRQGEAPRRRRRRALRARARRPRRRRPPLHRLQAPRRERAASTGTDAAAARGERRRAAAAVEPHVLQHVGVLVPDQPRQLLRLPQRHATRRRDDGDQEQRRRVGAVEEAPAVRREPRLRPGAGAGDADGNVRIHGPAEPLRGSLGGAKLLGQFIGKRRRRSEAMLCGILTSSNEETRIVTSSSLPLTPLPPPLVSLVSVLIE